MTICQHGLEKCSICHDADGTLWPLSETSYRFDLIAHLHRQRAWSKQTFGPGERTTGVVDHIRKELIEIEAKPTDLTEWIDVVILALDGAWRSGFTPHQIVDALIAKQIKNEGRKWPDWRTAEPGKAIEHVREDDPTTLCENCFPEWGEHEVLTIVPLAACSSCGNADMRHNGGVPCHSFRRDPRRGAP